MRIFVRCHVGVDAIDQFVTFQSLEGTEEPIPDRENIAVVGIRVRLHVVMVYVVHVAVSYTHLDVYKRQVNICEYM